MGTRKCFLRAGCIALLLPFVIGASACDLPDDIAGTWYAGTPFVTIEDDLTGILWGNCSAHETLTASALPQGFHLNVQWNHISDCSAATADVYFASPTECNIATGTYTNTPNGTPQAITLQRLPVNAYFSDQPYGSMIPADATVNQQHPYSLHASRILTQIQLGVLLLEQFPNALWIPAPNRRVVLESSRPSSDTIVQPEDLTDSNGWTTAWVQTMDNGPPSPQSSFKVKNSSINTPDEYVTNWLPAKYASTFLMTAYFAALEADYATGPLENRNGLPPGYFYHADFLNAVKFQGSGQGLDGRNMHYEPAHKAGTTIVPAAWVLNGNDGAGCISASGICAVDSSTTAVDPLRVPFFSLLSHPDDLPDNYYWYAHDTGGLITGLHIDRYFGFRRTDAQHYKVTHHLTLSIY